MSSITGMPNIPNTPNIQHGGASATTFEAPTEEPAESLSIEESASSSSPHRIRQRFTRTQELIPAQSSPRQESNSTMKESENNLNIALEKSSEEYRRLLKKWKNISFWKKWQLSSEQFKYINDQVRDAGIFMGFTQNEQNEDEVGREYALEQLPRERSLPLKEVKRISKCVRNSVDAIEDYIKKNAPPKYTAFKWIVRGLLPLGGVAAYIMVLKGFETRDSLYIPVTTASLTWVINEILMPLLNAKAQLHIEPLITLKEEIFSPILRRNMKERIKILKEEAQLIS